MYIVWSETYWNIETNYVVCQNYSYFKLWPTFDVTSTGGKVDKSLAKLVAKAPSIRNADKSYSLYIKSNDNNLLNFDPLIVSSITK